MNFDFKNEMWLYVLGGVVLAGVAFGVAMLIAGHGAGGLNLPG